MIFFFERCLDRDGRWLISGVIVGCVALAVSNAFVMDDAFISFRYARNLVETGELTWNPGEAVPVEGYTNFLWTLLLAAALAVGFEPIITSQVLGLAACVGTLWVTYRLALGVLGSPGRAALAVGLLGTNYTFSCFATGGLETQLQTLLITACAGLAWWITQPRQQIPGPRPYVAYSVVATAAVMTRLDSALPCSIFAAWVGVSLLRQQPTSPELRVRLLGLVGPAVLGLGPWLGWKLAYYGELLPNTFYSKVSGVSAATLEQGLGYGVTFLTSYQLLPMTVLAIAMGKRLWRRVDLRVLSVVVLSWWAYLVRVGGDFMEFRMVVPVLPLLFVLITFLLFELQHRGARVVLVTLLVVGSGLHALRFTDGGNLDSVATLAGYIENEWDHWPRVGEVLGELFGGAPEPVMIATTAAGAVPYMSRLPTIDMLGLNDLWVARHGVLRGSRTGHGRHADFQYLLRRRVHLVLGHPRVGLRTEVMVGETTFPVHRLAWFSLVGVEPQAIPQSSRVLEIPIDANYAIQVLYLVRHPRVDEVIEQQGLRTWPLDQG